jgi:hypothetical protein
MVLRASVTSEQSASSAFVTPNAWKAHVMAVETLSQSIDIPRSFQLKDEIHYIPRYPVRELEKGA